LHCLLLGCLSFLPFYLFDYNKLKGGSRWLNLLFAVGVLSLGGVTLTILLTAPARFVLPGVLRAGCLALSLVSLGLMFYALFFALPFSKTYVTGENSAQVVDTGLYALCRHPGVLFFCFFYLFLYGCSGQDLMFWAWLLFTAMDLLHVAVQDRYIFPKSLPGYGQYQQRVPFLLPTGESLRRCLQTLR